MNLQTVENIIVENTPHVPAEDIDIVVKANELTLYWHYAGDGVSILYFDGRNGQANTYIMDFFRGDFPEPSNWVSIKSHMDLAMVIRVKYGD